MRWSKLKMLTEARFAESVKKRLTINSTRYGNCHCGHAWLSLDGEIVANFCTRAYYNRLNDLQDEKTIPHYKNQAVEYGEMSRQDVYQACWTFVHELSIEQALASDNPLIQSLAVVDGRLGKKRLLALEDQALHPLAKKLLRLRLNKSDL